MWVSSLFERLQSLSTGKVLVDKLDLNLTDMEVLRSLDGNGYRTNLLKLGNLSRSSRHYQQGMKDLQIMKLGMPA